MNNRISLLSAAIGASLLLTTAAGTAFAADLRTAAHPVDGQYIVVLKNSAATLAGESNRAARVAAVASDIATSHRANLIRSYDRVLRGFTVKADDAALARLLADPRVAYVEEDGYVSIDATQTGATWGLDRVDQRNLPLSTTYTYNTTAAGVHAYIIDTGMLASHNEYAGRVGNGFDAVGGGTNDCHGHGTHVAGTVGGSTYGVAKGVTLHPVRVLDCGGSGTWAGVIAGIDWVAANRVLPAVANMSLGGGANASVDAAVANLSNAGVTVAVAAGNDYGGDACLKSPAAAPSAITVASTDSNDSRSGFSNIGTCVDIFAPGGAITSAWNTGNTATNTISGTSMASPHVAGAAALHLASNPSATPAQVTTALINASTPNVVTNPGAGSPNRLLYTLGGGGGTPPVITGLSCAYAADYNCRVTYNSSTAATVHWSGGLGQAAGDWYYGVCGNAFLQSSSENANGKVSAQLLPPGEGYYYTVRATVSNGFGSVSASRRLYCPISF
ncbi:MAG: S8 family peptidase [Lysobacter sp.]|nr:S8 family peptidase [Lysobacter sp.]